MGLVRRMRRAGVGADAPPPLHSRQPSAWWDGVSNIVTQPAHEHVTLADVLAG